MVTVLIVGATSAIAEATARLYAQEEASFYLLARNEVKLKKIGDDLRIRGARKIFTRSFEAENYNEHSQVIDDAIQKLDGIDIALLAHGFLPDQRECEKKLLNALSSININFVSMISFLTKLANHFEDRRSGTIAVISSVAGDRGRASNYVYGSAKGGLSVFLQGLHNRLHRSGVNVVTIKPGLVRTPMTLGIKRSYFMSSPRIVAKGIVLGIRKRRNVVYCPRYWRFIMIALRIVPDSLFRLLRI